MQYHRERAVEYARLHVEEQAGYRSGSDADGTAFVSRCVGAGFGLDLCISDADALAAILSEHATETDRLSSVQPGDVIQIRQGKHPYRSLLVTECTGSEVLVAAHSYSACDRPLSSYSYRAIRIFCLHEDAKSLSL